MGNNDMVSFPTGEVRSGQMTMVGVKLIRLGTEILDDTTD